MLSPEMKRLLKLPKIKEKLDDIKLSINREPQNPEYKKIYQEIQNNIKNLKPKMIKDKMKVIGALS